MYNSPSTSNPGLICQLYGVTRTIILYLAVLPRSTGDFHI